MYVYVCTQQTHTHTYIHLFPDVGYKSNDILAAVNTLRTQILVPKYHSPGLLEEMADSRAGTEYQLSSAYISIARRKEVLKELGGTYQRDKGACLKELPPTRQI